MSWTKTLATLLENDALPRRLLLYGPPGTGKTTFAFNTAKTTKRQVFRVTLDPGSYPDALLGQWTMNKTGTHWQDGPAVRAMRAGGILLLDEIDRAGNDINSTLRSVLDDENATSVDLPTGETVTPAAGYSVIATMNGNPSELAEPLADRFDGALLCDGPADGLVASLPKDLRAYVVNDTRNSKVQAWSLPITPRRVLAYARLRAAIGTAQPKIDIAAQVVFGQHWAEVLTAITDANRNES